MGWDAWFVVAVVGFVLLMLAVAPLGPDLILISGLALLLYMGILTPAEALAGFANEGMATVGILFVVSAGVVETGAVGWLASRMLGRPRTVPGAILRIMLPSAGLSAFLNNTPLVAMLIPAIADWGKQYRIAPAKLMIPLSYAAILGGACTLIGTSTNLIVNGMLITAAKAERVLGQATLPDGLRMFDITWVAFPALLVGMTYIALTNRWILPDRPPARTTIADPRQYTVEMTVADGAPLIGQTIEEAGLRQLPGLFLAEIYRDGVVLPAVGPKDRLHAHDQLVFVGDIDSVVDLQRFRGLVPASDQVFKLKSPRIERSLIEAVASPTCPIVGKTIRDGRFRSRYNAVVVAVARHGERLSGKIGDIVLHAGDVLLLEAHPSFARDHRHNRDFFLVSQIQNTAPRRFDKAMISLVILFAMVGIVTLSETLGAAQLSIGSWALPKITMFKGALLAAALMLLTRCTSVTHARAMIDWSVLLAIAASLGIGSALNKTGAATTLTQGMISSVGGSAWLSLAVIYGLTSLSTELVTNNAAAALMFPFAVATSQNLGVSVMPFIIATMMAASASFATPIGYQTNLMVYGPGGYRFVDFLRAGVPLNVIIWLTSTCIIPLIWPW